MACGRFEWSPPFIKNLDTVLKWAYSANSQKIRASKYQMSNMEKPIVFLSHSSLDKECLVELKKILDERAAGSLNFFLSSDGESIRFGRNWVVKVSDALQQTKLMFVFLSSHSADSKWIHFEAGCAYALDIQVVPVCLPGIDLNRITPPLGLLQGFNLHTHEAMGNLARICNETFNMKVNEKFSQNDFDSIVGNIIGHGAGFFGDQTWAINSINFSIHAGVPTKDFNPIPALHEICQKAGMNCHSSTEKTSPSIYNNHEVLIAKVEVPGCHGTFKISETTQPRNPQATTRDALDKTESLNYSLHFTLSPELFHINAPLLDQWLQQAHFTTVPNVDVTFGDQIDGEKQRHRLTTKLYQCGIDAIGIGNKGFQFDGFQFHFASYENRVLFTFNLTNKLEDKRLSAIIERLFKSRVIWEREPDFSEIFQGG